MTRNKRCCLTRGRWCSRTGCIPDSELDLARRVFDGVTDALVDHVELDVSKQRLDSTHVYSNMAMFGRTSLMVKAVQRLLTQVLRHHRERYDALPEVVERLEDKGRKPKELLADTAYGSDENVQECVDKGIELVAPVKKRHEGNEDAVSSLDFEIDESTGKVD